MQIRLNGHATEISEQCTIADLVTKCDLNGRRLAVEVNRELVPRSQFETYRLNADDQVEMIQAVGGG